MALPFSNIGEVWRRASVVQRVLLAGVVLGCLAGAAALVNWARKPSLALLRSGLSYEDAARITDKLRDARVQYELRNGGRAVYVPEDQVYSLRLMVASAGLPTGESPGYGLFDKDSGLGASPFTERVKLRRAIEGELARSIQTLDAVRAARVHLELPEPTLFPGKDRKRSATVVVTLKGGSRLGAGNVAAVTHLVAGAVDGLAPDEVVVVDSRGNLLTRQADDGMSLKMTTVLDHRRQLEEYLAKKAAEPLIQVLGPGRATVQVAVEMDPNSVQSERTRYGPDKPVPIKEMIQTTKSTEPATDKGTPAGQTSDSVSESEMVVGETVERTIDPPGDILSKTISVVVDLSPPASTGEEGASAGAKKALTVADVEELVKNALGWNEATDKLAVKEATFYRSPEAAGAVVPDEGLFTKDFILEIAKRSSLGLLVLGMLLALRMFRGGRKAAAEAESAAALEGAGAASGRLLPAAAEGNPDLLRAQITKALRDNPEEVKRLFLSWVESEKGAE